MNAGGEDGTDELTATNEEADELVSHVLALRMDFVQQLLRERGIPFSGKRKLELRDQVRQAIRDDRLTVAEVVAFLDRSEPGGKQHVFVMRPTVKYNGKWKDLGQVRRRLKRRDDVKELVDARVPLLMPEELSLSSVRLEGDEIEVVAVEARRYTERDESYDQEDTSDEGLPVYLRAFVERVARSTVTLRWNVKRRHATLHITQATGRGLETDHYRSVRKRFAEGVAAWLDLDEFKDVDLHKVIYTLQQKEQSGGSALTRSRQGQWSTAAGGELAATSPSSKASVFAETDMKNAVGAVASNTSGLSGNLYWLAGNTNPLAEDLHLRILAGDGRINFMVPSSLEVVEHVIDEIRSLL